MLFKDKRGIKVFIDLNNIDFMQDELMLFKSGEWAKCELDEESKKKVFAFLDNRSDPQIIGFENEPL
jgi:hypothetical protein